MASRGLSGELVGEERIIHKELNYAVVGCAQRVRAALGPGFPEGVYHHALCRELTRTKIPFQSQPEFEVTYDCVVCGRSKADLFVDEKIILELKAVDELCEQHEAQALAYPKASGVRVGILMNFGETRFVFKRFVN